ncbi:MAG TPA: glutamine synthetase III [Gemmatimonadales bacterium]|nr:glutamine synthetase III [Gemmatimonadales bacterium]
MPVATNNRTSVTTLPDRRSSDRNGTPPQTSVYFGLNTFSVREMRDALPRKTYSKLLACIRHGHMLDLEIAPTVAEAIREWAVSRGATHFTHWFQPQNGLTAEKHDAFLDFGEDGQPLESFTASQLIQSEPDASSFPSGGLRATWEARGYTAWNPASPPFILESGGTRTLCIPSVFIGYNGEALDETTPLLRSMEALSRTSMELLQLLGDKGMYRVYTTLGVEQEYFLVDRDAARRRPDLIMANRTVIGAAPPRGQQLEDHYFGGIPERIQACIAEVEHELYKLGVPITTRHNEVAPSQYEMAPRYQETDVAVDHNQLVMATLRKVAIRHGLHAIVHEKPFAGINGSGKHCNWSLAIGAEDSELDGFNLLQPGSTPHQNMRFLLFLAAVLQAVHRNAGLLRAGIASSGNEHRLGANEAPPAIISVFMGRTLTSVIEDLAEGRENSADAAKAMLHLGVAKLPQVTQDNTDRNRTSPFAFTGSKFEFRAVGGSQNPAFPVMLLNSCVAHAIADITARIRARMNGSHKADDAALAVVREVFRDTASVRFEGNNYSDEWVEEAERRGLPHLRHTPEALVELMKPESLELFTSLGILTEAELHSRYHVHIERYVKDLLIEHEMLIELAETMVQPAAFAYLADLADAASKATQAGINAAAATRAANEVAGLLDSLQAGLDADRAMLQKVYDLEHSTFNQARLLTDDGATAMQQLRAACDALELKVPAAKWPLPKYREMLFGI